MNDIDSLIERLVRRLNRSTSARVQSKAQKALSDIKRAMTILEKAQLTLIWCEREDGLR